MKQLRSRITLSLLLVFFGSGIPAARLAAQEAAPEAAPGEVYADIPGTRVSLRLPAGYSLAEGFPGIVRHDYRAALLAAEISAPLEQVLAGMTEQELANEGVRLLRTEKTTVNGMDATVIHAMQQEPEGEVRKWIALFGTGQLTVLLAASLPAPLEAEAGAALEQAIRTARWDPAKPVDMYAGMGFSLRESEIFEIRGRRPGGVLLARRDAPEQLSPAEPIVVVYPVASAAVAPLAMLARQQLTEGGQFVDFSNFVERPLIINGLNSYEIIADARESSLSVPVRIMLVLVRASDRDMIIEAIVQPASWDQYLPEFRRLAESFRITSTGHSH